MSRRYCGYGLWLLWLPIICPPVMGASLSSTGRDPFTPFRCLDAAVETSWRLRGVVGHPGQWIGWLSTPEHPWLEIRIGEVVLSSGWHVGDLDQHRVRLVKSEGGPPCAGSPREHVLLAPLQHHDNVAAP